MTISREKLTAFIDGELPTEQDAEFEELLAARPRLRAYVETQRALESGMRAAFSPVINEAIPDRLIEAVRQSPISWRWRLARLPQILISRGFLLRTGLPAAAALACGLIVGLITERSVQRAISIAPNQNGVLIAQGPLAGALNRQLASTQNAADFVHIGVSYRASDGRYCRSFQLGANAGVACRDPAAWTIVVLASATSPSRSAYQPAGAAMPDAVRAEIKASIAGQAFDVASERRAREHGWGTR